MMGGIYGEYVWAPYLDSYRNLLLACDYELPTIRIVGAIIALIFTSAYVFAQFIAGGKAISMVLGVPYVWGLLGGMGVVIIYTITYTELTVKSLKKKEFLPLRDGRRISNDVSLAKAAAHTRQPYFL